MRLRWRLVFKHECPHDFKELRRYTVGGIIWDTQRYDLYCPICEKHMKGVRYDKAERILKAQAIRKEYYAN